MLNRNSMVAGFLLGCIMPAIAYVVFNVLYKNVTLLHKPALPYLVAIGLNLIIIRFCYKKDVPDTGKGVILATFISMIIFVVFKVKLT